MSEVRESAVRLSETFVGFKPTTSFIEVGLRTQPRDELAQIHEKAAEQQKCEGVRNHSSSLLRRSCVGTLPM
jgi:hypothetical protein